MVEPLPTMTVPMAEIQTPASARTDDKIWEDILKLQLNGVMMHIALFEYFKSNGICGMAAMHKHHAEEEFETYMHVTGDYIDLYKKSADVSNVSQPPINIDGATDEEKMIKGMDAYENWEKQTCKHLKKYQKELSEDKHYVDHLINNVHEEIKCIHLIQNDLLDGKYEELDKWLNKKWGSD